MPRKLRLEYPGACYHVINRGSDATDIFETRLARDTFLEALGETCEKSGWVAHAYALMRNHFHLALETPRGNLAAGMQWLQATFANRFNHVRCDRGRLFQGRYRALLVEPGAALGQVVHFIHLHPVRSGFVAVERLRDYAASSYPLLWRPGERPPWLQLRTGLAQCGCLVDDPQGWEAYAAYLGWQAARGPAGAQSPTYHDLTQGWALGSDDFRTTLASERLPVADQRLWEAPQARRAKEARWEALLSNALRALGRREGDLFTGPKSGGWKVAIAIWMKECCQVSNVWLGDRLGIGHAAYVGRLVCGARQQPPQELDLLRERCVA